MPVIINSKEPHPFLPSVGSLQAIDSERAEKQDIRPLEIVIVNLMADKRTTERQLAAWIGHTPLQINVTFCTTDEYIEGIRKGKESKNTPSKHIKDFYKGWSEIKDQKFEGLILTGVNALKERVEEEDFWGDVTKILDWSRTNVFSSLFLCWGSQAALKYFHDINSIKQHQKLWGVFEHFIASDKTGILEGFNDYFNLPVSRWKTPERWKIENNPLLEIVADSEQAGANVIVEPEQNLAGLTFARRLYLLSHPEYETDSLKTEYLRDLATKSGKIPLNYFINDDPNSEPKNTWRSCGHLYTNWIKSVYEATPYDLNDIPDPCSLGDSQNTAPAKRLIDA